MNVLDRARTNVVQSYLLSKGTICKDASGSIWKILQLWAGRQLENSLSRGLILLEKVTQLVGVILRGARGSDCDCVLM